MKWPLGEPHSSAVIQAQVRRETVSHGPQLKSGNPGRLLGQASAGREEKPSLCAELDGSRARCALRAPTLVSPNQEELEFCEKLLQTCFSSPTDDSMDR